VIQEQALIDYMNRKFPQPLLVVRFIHFAADVRKCGTVQRGTAPSVQS